MAPSTQRTTPDRPVARLVGSLLIFAIILVALAATFFVARGFNQYREALAALKTARIEADAVVCWADLHHDAFRAAAAASRLFGRTAAFHRALLEEYDAENDAELAPTAEALARAYGDVRAAAEQLHQHPNTVRYRLKKIKEVLSVQDATDRELAALLTLAYLT